MFKRAVGFFLGLVIYLVFIGQEDFEEDIHIDYIEESSLVAKREIIIPDAPNDSDVSLEYMLPTTDSIIQNGSDSIIPYLEPDILKIKIKKGDNLVKILRSINVSGDVIREIIYNVDDKGVFGRLKIGQGVEVRYVISNNKTEVIEIILEESPISYYSINRSATGFTLHKKSKEITEEIVLSKGSIEDNFYNSAIKYGLSAAHILKIIKTFESRVNMKSLQKGDTYVILYGINKVDDQVVSTGDVVSAGFKTKGKTYLAFNVDGKFYDEDGKSLDFAMNRHPTQSPSVSSRFNPKRLHPILRIRRPHYGTDYRGSLNTKILSVGDGVVAFAGRNGGFGKMIKIQHSNGYQSWYAHLNSINKSIKKGARVSRGQIIGYMGTTGMSTGVHLHFELRKNGTAVDSLRQELPTASDIKITGDIKSKIEKYKAMMVDDL